MFGWLVFGVNCDVVLIDDVMGYICYVFDYIDVFVVGDWME